MRVRFCFQKKSFRLVYVNPSMSRGLFDPYSKHEFICQLRRSEFRMLYHFILFYFRKGLVSVDWQQPFYVKIAIDGRLVIILHQNRYYQSICNIDFKMVVVSYLALFKNN